MYRVRCLGHGIPADINAQILAAGWIPLPINTTMFTNKIKVRRNSNPSKRYKSAVPTLNVGPL